jgi:hypothetical protein
VKLNGIETAKALRALASEGRVQPRKGGGFAIADAERKRMAAAAQESQANADLALAEWRVYLMDQWPGLLPEHVEQLEADLRLFLHTVIARHGAEASMLLYPDDPAAEAIYGAMEENGFGLATAVAPEVEAIRDAALSHFVRRPSEVQRDYLAQTLNTGYFLTVLSIDPEGARSSGISRRDNSSTSTRTSCSACSESKARGTSDLLARSSTGLERRGTRCASPLGPWTSIGSP